MAAGQIEADLLAEYPEMEVVAFQAVLLFAADAVHGSLDPTLTLR